MAMPGHVKQLDGDQRVLGQAADAPIFVKAALRDAHLVPPGAARAFVAVFTRPEFEATLAAAGVDYR